MPLKNTLAYMSDFCNFIKIWKFEEEGLYPAPLGDQDTAEAFC